MITNLLGITEDIEIASSLSQIEKSRPVNYKPYTTTLQMQRELQSSRVIIRAMRKFTKKNNLNNQNEIKPKVTQVIRFDGDTNSDEYTKFLMSINKIRV